MHNYTIANNKQYSLTHISKSCLFPYYIQHKYICNKPFSKLAKCKHLLLKKKIIFVNKIIKYVMI